MSIFLGTSLRCRFSSAVSYRRFSSAVSYRYPIPKDLVSGSAPRSDLNSNVDRRPMQLCLTVGILIHLRELDKAAEYARFAYSRTYCDSTASTCELIIGAMCEVKRYRDALDLFHYFYNELKMRPTFHSPGHIIKALCELGRVDDALLLFRAMSSPGLSYCHLTKGMVSAGRLDEALCLVRKCPSPQACSNLISGFLKLGNLDMATQLLDEFKSNFEYSEAALLRVPFIEHWFKQGKDEEATRCYLSLLCNDEFNFCGDTGKAILKLLLMYGKKTEAWLLFHRMLDGFRRMVDGVDEIDSKVDSETIVIMMGECFKEGRFKDGTEIFYKGKAKLRYFENAVNRNVITSFCEQGMLSEAESVLADFTANDLPTCRAMMNAYVKAGRVDDALQTVNNTVDAKLRQLALMMLC